MTSEGRQPACELFTILDSRKIDRAVCDVCDQVESAHERPGRRTLSGGQIEEIRKRIIIDRYSLREQAEQSERDTPAGGS